jgi:uncharacterized protein YbbK (DUF523 family)
MEKVLVSSCLLGDPVRYNGADKRCDHEILRRWLREGRVVPVCPEVAGGLPVPRPPAEIAAGAGGLKVLSGAAAVVDVHGRDVSAHFVHGAQHALELARVHGIRIAVLKEGSPSCGTGYTYDGTFTGTRVSSPGVAAALLQQAGVAVFGEAQLAEAAALLGQIESAAGGPGGPG